LWALVLCALWIPIGAWIGQEIDGLVYTVEEVDLLRLEKHISVWKVDLEENRGGNRKLEVLLAQRLMRESSLLKRIKLLIKLFPTLQGYLCILSG
jgi:hypothetical protein